MHAPMLDLSRQRDTRTRPPRPYRLPQPVRDRLEAALQPFRNAGRALQLAVFLGRFWSMPGRVALPFPVDRRAIADREDLELTEGEVRGAIRTLEAVGFLDRWQTTGSRYKATEHGLRRKPIPYTFGAEFMPMFVAANARAMAARGGVSRPARPPVARSAGRRPTGSVEARVASASTKQSHNLPKNKAQAENVLLMGNQNRTRDPGEPHPALEAALARLAKAFGKAEAERRGRT